MEQTILSNLTLISSGTILLPLIIGLTRYRSLDETQKILGLLIIICTVTELTTNIMWFMRMRNLHIYQVFSVLNFNLILLVFRNHLGKRWKNPLMKFQITYTFLAIANSVFIQGYFSFNSNVTTSSSLIFISLSVTYFYKLLREVKYQKLEKTPMFWISAGILMYYSSTLILFLLGEVFEGSTLAREVALAAWGLNSIFNMMINTFYSLALWVKHRK
ncbi:MAG: hypothetical protein HEP71_29220 [Roseivirga sp.]|nr:hypothetical protein [Roseivirga sp.]